MVDKKRPLNEGYNGVVKKDNSTFGYNGSGNKSKADARLPKGGTTVAGPKKQEEGD